MNELDAHIVKKVADHANDAHKEIELVRAELIVTQLALENAHKRIRELEANHGRNRMVADGRNAEISGNGE